MCEEKGWAVVIEDGAPGHKKHAIACRELNQMEVIDWPPQSLDLNLIEAIWGDMEVELGMVFGCSTGLPELQQQCRLAFKMTKEERLLGLIKGIKKKTS